VVGNLAICLSRRGHEVLFLNSGNSHRVKSKTTQWGFKGFELNLCLPTGERSWVVSAVLFAVRFPIGLFKLIWLIKKHGIEIVNIHYPTESFFYFAFCRKLLSIKLVTSVHGADMLPDGKVKSHYPWSIRLLLNASDRIVAPSNAYREDVAKIFPHLRKKIVEIHNGVDLTEFECSEGSHPCAEGSRYLLCVAMHNEKKGIDVLIQGFARIQKTQPLLRLVLAGDGPLRAQFENLASSLGIAQRVDFLGHQNRCQVVDLLRGCEIFVLASRSEPFGIVLLEAMACQKPIISTRVGGIPEIIKHKENGILIPPDNPAALAEALTVLLDDPLLRSTIANQGFKTVHQRFSTQSTALGYETTFTEVQGRRPNETVAATVGVV
jgi:glycosyltransferase involved in cell wall biosynthesis